MNARLAIVVVATVASFSAEAQQSASPEPIVRTTIDPSRVMVGQPATLRIEVLAPNYMTAPPEMPGFQLRNAVTRQLRSVNVNEQTNDVEYAGVKFEFAIYPLEPGSFAIDGQKLSITYAADPPATREAVISLPRITFAAFVPEAAAELHPFVTARSLTIEQKIQRTGEQLKVGDAVTRVVTIKAEGTPAMLLPPTAFPATDGLAVYPAQPALQDKTAARSEMLSASRTDSATYMLEKPGHYVLPAVDVRWWSAPESRIETVHLDAVTIDVAANPAAQGAAGASDAIVRRSLGSLFDFVGDHWLVALIIAAAMALLAWSAPNVIRMTAQYRRRRRQNWLQSEACSFDRLRREMRRGDARAAYFALLNWLQRFEPAGPPHTVNSFKAVACDPVLDGEIDALQIRLFEPRREPPDWSPRRLLHHVGKARRMLRRRLVRSGRSHALPHRLNPTHASTFPSRRWRIPAR